MFRKMRAQGYLAKIKHFVTCKMRQLKYNTLVYYETWQMYFDIKLTFEKLPLREQQHSFLTHERMFLLKWRWLRDKNALTWRGLVQNPDEWKKNAFSFSYVKLTYQLLFKTRFLKSRQIYKRQVAKPQHRTPQEQSVATPLLNILVESIKST